MVGLGELGLNKGIVCLDLLKCTRFHSPGLSDLNDINGPHLNVRARGAQQIASQSHQPAPSKGWVEAGDLVANRLIPIPSPVRFILRHQTQHMTDRAIDAAAASYPSQPRRTATPASDGLTGRQHQDRQPGSPRHARVAPG